MARLRTTQLKRRAWAVALALLAVWPFIHFALVVAYDIHPWKLHGMAMYCQPRLREQVALYARIGGKRRPVRAAPQELLHAIERYLRNRRAIGDLASTRELQQIARQYMTQEDGLWLDIQRWQINPESRRMQSERSQQFIANSSLRVVRRGSTME